MLYVFKNEKYKNFVESSLGLSHYNVKSLSEVEKVENYKESYVDYSSNPCFPDLDANIGYIGVQYTVGNSHTCSAEMVIFLHNLKSKLTNSNKIIKDSSSYNSVKLDFDYVIISNKDNVKVNRRVVKERK